MPNLLKQQDIPRSGYSADSINITSCNILETKNGGIIRDPKGKAEPWESELLLVSSTYYKEDLLDLRSAGLFWYVFRLPMQANLRPVGVFPIACFWLSTGRGFNTYQEAKECFDNS